MEEVEIWKDIEGYEGLYQVSSFGRVKSLHFGKERILKYGKDKKGYLIVALCKNGKCKTCKVHRLVANCFLEPKEGKDIINHKDENKQNNHVDNLEFCNHTYNNNYGTKPERLSKINKGENNPFYGKKHTDETKQKIRKTLKGRIISEETKMKISESMLGKPKSEEHKQKLRKPILQLTKDNVFVREWDSAKSVSIELKIYATNITAVCKGKQKSAGGYIWRYK